MAELAAVLTPKQRTYVTRMQSHSDQTMFNSDLYRACVMPSVASLKTTGDTSEVLYVDEHLHSLSLLRSNQLEEKNSNFVYDNVSSVQEMENSSDLTLINSTFISSDGGLNDTSLLRSDVIEFLEPLPGNKRKINSADEDMPDKKRRMDNDNRLKQIVPHIQHHPSRYISSDFISSEGVECRTPDIEISPQFGYTQSFSQLKSSQYTPFPLYTAADITNAVISSFDPIFSSES